MKNDEISLLMKIRHPDPNTNTDAYIDSLPDKVVAKYYGVDQCQDDLRNGMKIFFKNADAIVASPRGVWFENAKLKQIAKLQDLLYEYYKR